MTNNGNLDEVKFKYFDNKFRDALGNDLNTSTAISILYEVLKDSDMNDITKRALVEKFDLVLSLDLLVEESTYIDEELKNYIEKEIEKRNEYKREKNFEMADKIRDELKDKGIIIKDTRDGTLYEII